MRRVHLFIQAVLAGVCVGIGGIAYLSIESKVVGALFFTIALFVILTYGMNLYTGKVSYVFEKDLTYALDVPIIWTGNLTGCVIMGSLVRLTRISVIAAKAAEVSAVKLGDSVLSVFILAVLCNFLILVAVDGFARNQHELGKYMGMTLAVSGFILCNFEHCIANMFYFTVAGVWSPKAFGYILIMTLGNFIGGVIIPVLRQLKEKSEAKTEARA